MRKLCLLTSFIFIIYSVQAQKKIEAVKIDAEFKSLMLDSEVGVYSSLSEAPGIAEISQFADSSFYDNPYHNFVFGLTKQAYWFKFNLKSAAPKSKSLLLELVNPNLDTIICFQFRRDSLIRLDTLGVDRGFTKRPIRHQNYLIPIEVLGSDSLTCLFYIGPPTHPLNFNMYLWDRDHRLKEQARSETMILGAYFLIMILFLSLLLLTNLVFKLKSLWYYGAYVLMGALFVFTDLGLGYRYFWAGSPYIQKMAVFLFTNLYLIFGTFFVREFFNTARLYPQFDRIFHIAIGITTAFLLFVLFIPYLPLNFVHLLDLLHFALFLLCSIAFVTLFIKGILSSNLAFSGWFLLGFSLHGAGVVITLLQFLRLLPKYSFAASLFNSGIPLITFFTQPMLMLGMLLEIPIVIYFAFKKFSYLVDQNNRQALQLARLREKNMNALIVGAESERRRLAQDLHDGLGVRLAAIKMKANLMEVKAVGDKRQHWQEIMEDISNTYQELRRVTHNLTPKTLFEGGLGMALEETILRFRTLRPNLKIHYFNNLPLNRINEQAAVHLYRIILEGINNVLKHANAHHLDLQLASFENQVILTIEDDGIGLADDRKEKVGIGLSNMRSRAEFLGGSMMIDSTQGQGTTIVLEFPADKIFRDKSSD